MHNLKEIRNDFDAFKKALEKRSVDIDFDKLKNLDIQNRELIVKKEKLVSKSKNTSIEDKKLQGKVINTFVKGKELFKL